MSEAKHTPGPWRIKAHTDESPEHITGWSDWSIIGADGACVCIEQTSINDSAKHNARLIAAAPELLEALQRLIGTGLDEQTHRAIMSEPAHFVNVAIAKATGEGK